MIKKENKWIRTCPNCNKEIEYGSKKAKSNAIRNNTNCVSCSQKNRKGNKKRNESISKAIKKWHKNNEHYLKGKSHSEKTKNKIRNTLLKNHPYRGKSYDEIFGVEKSKKIRKKQRIKRIDSIEKLHYQCRPRYNPDACKIIDEYGQKHGYNFQHALNGGEYYIRELGYWVDGYDKEKNVVIEYYEKHHSYKSKKDKIRENEIKDFLKCKLIIIRE